MPAVRLSRRRRSSPTLAAFTLAKPGTYRPVTFAPNVTPISYNDDDSTTTASEPASPSSTLFPPSICPEPPRSRRRVPQHKRRSLGYIPRPPNAFMLFRADFVRQKHVPGTIETNHGSLSKIIGNCWRSLPLDEKRVWEVKAKHEKAAHKARYPEYRFRPVHNKNKNKDKKDKLPTTNTIDDERRCEEVAQLLLEGMKGDELAAAVRDLDLRRADSSASPMPAFTLPLHHRRSSSVPLPNDYFPYPPSSQHFTNNGNTIALPSVPSFSLTRPPSPQQRMTLGLGQRRASSAQPYSNHHAHTHHRWWTAPEPIVLQRDDSPLPDVDTSLFNGDFGFGGVNVHHVHTHGNGQAPVLDGIAPHERHDTNNLDMHLLDFTLDPTLNPTSTQSTHDMDPFSSWMSTLDPSHSTTHSSSGSHPSTAQSSPVPRSPGTLVHAPQPLSAGAQQAVFTDLWKDFGAHGGNEFGAMDMGLGLDFDSMGMGMGMGMCVEQQQQQHGGRFVPPGPGLESLFEPQMFDGGY